MEKFEENNNINIQELGVSVHAVTGALKNFFKLLPEPLIPYDIGSKINDIMILMDAAERLKKLRSLVNDLPPVNLAVFKMFMCHLKRITEYKSVNKMDVRNLQTVLYPTLLRPNFESLQNMSQNMNMGLFIQTCIEQSGHIFEMNGQDQMTISTHNNTENTKFYADEKEKPNDEVSLMRIENENCDTNDGIDPLPTSTDLSFTESVFTDPGMENLINLHPDTDIKLHVNFDMQSKIDKRKSIETAIY